MFYEKFVNFNSEKKSGSQLYAKCPIHFDSNESFTVNEDTLDWYCHGCGFGGGEVAFIEHYFDVTIDTAIYAQKYYTDRKEFPFPTPQYVKACVKEFNERKTDKQQIMEMGITESVLNEFEIGWDDVRLIIPIKSRTGFYVNVRKYLPQHRRAVGSSNAKVIQMKGVGKPRYFPYESFDIDDITIVEGEKDCLVARSQGINAVTSTGGSNIPTHEIHLFQDKDVTLMLDNDPTGNRLLKQYIKLLRGVARTLKIIKLPVKDFADYWKEFHTSDVSKYISTTVDEIKSSTISDCTTDATSLRKSEYVENLNSWIKLENMSVIGTDPKTYTVPSKLKVLCKDSTCTRPCQVGNSSNATEIDVDPRQLLQFVDAADSVQDNYLKKLFGCKSIISEPSEYVNVQKILFQESASFMDGLEDASFENRYGIYLYEESRLIPTVKYVFESCRVTDPRSQQNYYVIRSAEQIAQGTVIDAPDSVEYFKSIADGCTNFMELLDKHYDVWKSCLGIEGRTDLFGAMVLTYLSVTEVQWKSGTLKGWLDTMVIGDTRTGKSQMAQRMVKQIQMGAYINGENARRTGIIGGVQRFGDSWVITWGAIPMNDKGLLIVDEASGLEVDDIKELSATRSSGAVTINKIAKGEAKARTRLMWLSNPRSGRNLEDFYWKGYGAFMEFIPVVEDQARYDLVLTAAREDVTELNGIPDSGPIPVSKWCDLINLAWTIPKERVRIQPDTEVEVAKCAKRLSADYEGGPLVVSVAVHEKVIRLACAIAILSGSIAHGEVIVLPQHVTYGEEFLRFTYDKVTLDYKGFILEAKKAQRNKAENTNHIRSLCVLHPALKVLLSSDMFRGSQVREVLGLEQSEASQLVSDLLRRGLLKISGSGAYKPDKTLIDIAKQMNVE